MTETQPLPTDSEILDAADDFRSQYMHGGITFDEFDSIGFARAVLAKWGTPPAVAGEHKPGCPALGGYGHGVEDCCCGATPQPTQAQAGQLADEQIEDLLECGNPTDEEKRLIRMGWDAARNAQAVQAGAVPLTASKEVSMAMSDEQIDMIRCHSQIPQATDREYLQLTRADMRVFARSIEAEVRAQDTALIRQLVDALENHAGNYKLTQLECQPHNAAVAAGRARLKGKP